MSLSFNNKTWLLVLIALLFGLSGCGRDKVQRAAADVMYQRGNDAMKSANFRNAIAYFEQLEARFPFSNLTKQARLDLVYAYYRNGEPESAIDAADTFMRENPTHPRVDYCLYIKGLAYFDRDKSMLERLFRVDLTQRPPRDSRLSFDSFSTLLRRFPDSEYSPDARQRMVFLRNRLAEYENHVARYYIERGAFVAAANRARFTIEHYPGSPALADSLEILSEAYRRAGMPDLATDTDRILADSFPEGAPGKIKKKRRWRWWKRDKKDKDEQEEQEDVIASGPETSSN